MMTTKSDDVDGRVRVYGAIVKGDDLRRQAFRNPSRCCFRKCSPCR